VDGGAAVHGGDGLVNPDDPWSPPAVLPPSFSLAQWEYVFTYSEIVRAMLTSFALAPIVTILSFFLSLPTAYAIGRLDFPGKDALRILILLPIVRHDAATEPLFAWLAQIFAGHRPRFQCPYAADPGNVIRVHSGMSDAKNQASGCAKSWCR
jgi:hypothetical protein